MSAFSVRRIFSGARNKSAARIELRRTLSQRLPECEMRRRFVRRIYWGGERSQVCGGPVVRVLRRIGRIA